MGLFIQEKNNPRRTTSHNLQNGQFCCRTRAPPSASFGNISAKNQATKPALKPNWAAILRTKYTTGATDYTTNTHSRTIQDAITQQMTIGVNMMARGYIGIGWMDTVPTARHPTRIMNKLQCMVWMDFFEPLWQNRNELLHQQKNNYETAENAALTVQLRWYQSNRHTLLAHHDHALLHNINMSTLQTMPSRHRVFYQGGFAYIYLEKGEQPIRCLKSLIRRISTKGYIVDVDSNPGRLLSVNNGHFKVFLGTRRSTYMITIIKDKPIKQAWRP